MNDTSSLQERRQSLRQQVGFEVLVSGNQDEVLIMQAVNQSKTGIYLLSEGVKRPALGTMVDVILNQNLGKQHNPKLKMLVTRMDKDGLGLEYIKASRDIS